MAVDIHGFCEPAFEHLKQAFAANFDEGLELGASLAATHQGRTVLDLWAGWANRKRSRPWGRDTIVGVTSSTKIPLVLSALMLADRGRLELEAPVMRYWPEFGHGGKQGVSVRDALTHRAGVPGFDPPLGYDDLRDWKTATANLAAQAHRFGGRPAFCYHPVTYGFLIGELIRRVDGRRPAQFFREEVADPIGADFQMVLAAEAEMPRVAQLQLPQQLLPPPKDELEAYVMASMVGPPDWTFSSQAVDRPASSGFANARSIARVCAILALGGELDGRRFLSRQMVEEAGREQVYVHDPFMGWISFGLGFGLDSTLFPAPTPTSFHWGGMGGSYGLMDAHSQVSLGYAPNNWDLDLSSGDPRLQRIWQALGEVMKEGAS